MENTDDSFSSQLLERLAGVTVLDNAKEIIEGLPVHLYDALAKHGANLKKEDCIFKEDFFDNIRKRICELYSQK